VLPPCVTERLALSVLPFLVLLEMAHREPGQHHRPPRAACLRLDNLKFAADPLHGPAYVKLPRSEIDVIPPQRQQLTAAKTGHQRQDVESLQPLAADHLEQALSLRDVQAHAALAVDRRSLYLCRHVPGHQLHPVGIT
jgi:hypothetical protein